MQFSMFLCWLIFIHLLIITKLNEPSINQVHKLLLLAFAHASDKALFILSGGFLIYSLWEIYIPEFFCMSV